jgi:PAS domain S-box-containing protein
MSFRLLLSSPGGVRVLAQPTWWNLEHTLATFGLMMLLVFAALAWVASLRYRVREQTEIIRRRLEHQTVLEERFKDLVEHAVEGIFRIAPDGRYAAVNKALARMLGYESPADVMNNRNHSDCQNYVASDRQAEFVRLLDECGSVERFEYQARRKDGSIIWVSENARAVRRPSGELLDYEGTVVDVTERKRAEESLRQSDERFSKAFRASPIPICISTLKEGRYLDVNDSFLQLLGFNREEVIGHTSLELRIWAEPSDLAKMVQRLREQKYLRDTEIDLRAKSGEMRRVLFSIEFIEIESESCTLAILHDVTDRLRLEEQLRQAQKMEAVGQLAAGVAHDFNNILTVIQGNAGLLQSDFGLAPELCELAKQISVASARAAGLTRQLLMFSRKQVIQPRALDLNELISNLTKMLSRIIGEHINLQFNYYPRLPEIYADPGMIEQVILNLAVNARDAMPQAGQLMLSTSGMELDEDTARTNPERAPATLFV